LLPKIRGGVEKEPTRWKRRNSNLRLSARTSLAASVAQSATVWTITIPLGETAPGSRAEDFYAHSSTFASDRFARFNELELGVGVRTDLAVEVDLFVLRGNPFHG